VCGAETDRGAPETAGGSERWTAGGMLGRDRGEGRRTAWKLLACFGGGREGGERTGDGRERRWL
jgi:hypothetical protein